MVIFLTYRNGVSGVLPRLKVRGGKRYKVRTPIEMLRLADPQYSCGKEVRGESIRQLYKDGRSIQQGERMDYVGNIRGYEVSGALPRVIERTKVRSKTAVDIAIDDTADVLLRTLKHRGYQANDALAELCNDGQQTVMVNTTIYWVERGVKLQVHIGSIRVKKVIRTDSTRLLPEYFTDYLPHQWKSTTFAHEEISDIVYELTTTTKVIDKMGYRHRYIRPVTNYGFMLNGDDLRDLREKVKMARLTAGYKQIEL